VDDLERLDRVAADIADHGVLADAFEVRFRPDGVTRGAARGDIRIAEAEALGGRVVAGGRRGGGDGDVADADGDAVARFGALHVDRAGDLVAAAQARRDHRAP